MRVTGLRWAAALALLLLLAACGDDQQQPAGDGAGQAGAPAATSATGGGYPAPTAAGSAGNTSYPDPGAGPPAGERGPVVDQDSFLAQLRELGLTVEVGDAIQQEVMGIAGTSVRVTGGGFEAPVELQLYNYPDQAAADATVDQIQPDGNFKTAMVHWVAPPHFFRGERLIVLYLGDDQNALDMLTQVLGPQFAGR